MTTICSAHPLDYITNSEPEKTKRQDAGHTVKQTINTIFDSSEDAVFGVDAEGNIGYLNQRCNELFGLPQNISIKGKHCSDLLCGGDEMCSKKCCTQCAIQHNIESEQQINDFQINIKQADGTKLMVNVGTCYFYQDDRHETSTYFSLRKIVKT